MAYFVTELSTSPPKDKNLLQKPGVSWLKYDSQRYLQASQWNL